jgi:hypothetical protein
MIQTEGSLPISKVHPKKSPERSPEERNIRKQLGKVRRYLAKSTDANIKSSWESRIIVYEAQLKRAEARARFIG